MMGWSVAERWGCCSDGWVLGLGLGVVKEWWRNMSNRVCFVAKAQS